MKVTKNNNNDNIVKICQKQKETHTSSLVKCFLSLLFERHNCKK